MNSLTLSNIKRLPLELERVIASYLPIKLQYQLTKKKYLQYCKHVKLWIHKNNQYENYIRDTIRKNNEFTFYFILKENYNHWIQRKKYHYHFTNI